MHIEFSIKLILESLRHVSVFLHHLQRVLYIFSTNTSTVHNEARETVSHTFAKLRKATISFGMSARLFVRPSASPPAWINLAPIGMVLNKFDI